MQTFLLKRGFSLFKKAKSVPNPSLAGPKSTGLTNFKENKKVGQPALDRLISTYKDMFLHQVNIEAGSTKDKQNFKMMKGWVNTRDLEEIYL